MKEPRGAPVVTLLLLVYRNLDIRGYTSYIGCYGRVTNDSKGSRRSCRERWLYWSGLGPCSCVVGLSVVR